MITLPNMEDTAKINLVASKDGASPSPFKIRSPPSLHQNPLDGKHHFYPDGYFYICMLFDLEEA